jgi:hypothetical protein
MRGRQIPVRRLSERQIGGDVRRAGKPFNYAS